MNTDIMIATYNVLSSYIPEKERQDAASSLISEIAEHPISERELKSFAASDKYLKIALQEYLCEDAEDDEDEDFDDYDD